MATFFWWTFFFHHLLVCFSVPFLLFFSPLYYLYTDPVLVLLLLWLLLLLLILSWDEFFLDQLLVGLWGRVQGGFLCKQYSLWLLGNFLMAPVYVVEWILLKLFFPLEGDQQLHDCCLPRAPPPHALPPGRWLSAKTKHLYVPIQPTLCFSTLPDVILGRSPSNSPKFSLKERTWNHSTALVTTLRTTLCRLSPATDVWCIPWTC